MQSYSGISDLPQARWCKLDVAEWVQRNTDLISAVSLRVTPGPELTLWADGDQLDQLLTNLLKNAQEAMAEASGHIWVTLTEQEGYLCLRVADQGPGLAATTHLFVPFFTTKTSGSGIGLFVSLIAESHGGTLSLQNRHNEAGCQALVRLPVLHP